MLTSTSSVSTPPGPVGELEVIKLVKCPNCDKKLELLPTNYPMYDVQCTGCYFRAQIKSINDKKPQDQLFGAGWDVIDKVLKAGYAVPPLIANYNWQENGIAHQKILFYPFIPKKNLKKYTLSPNAQSANSRRFNYIGMRSLPYFVLYQKP